MKTIILTSLLITGLYAQAEIYKADTTASQIQWTGFKKMGSSHTGQIKLKEGSVEVTKKNLTKAEFTVDMSTISNDDLVQSPEFQKKLVTHLSSEDFFNSAKYPTASFKLISAKSTGKNEFTVKGDLTMIGNTQSVEFPLTVKFEKNQALAEAKIKIDRTKWGLKYGSGNFFKELAADKIISDEFELNIKITAKK